MQSIAETCVRFDGAHIHQLGFGDRGTHVYYLKVGSTASAKSRKFAHE